MSDACMIGGFACDASRAQTPQDAIKTNKKAAGTGAVRAARN